VKSWLKSTIPPLCPNEPTCLLEMLMRRRGHLSQYNDPKLAQTLDVTAQQPRRVTFAKNIVRQSSPYERQESKESLFWQGLEDYISCGICRILARDSNSFIAKLFDGSVDLVCGDCAESGGVIQVRSISRSCNVGALTLPSMSECMPCTPTAHATRKIH
jgi:hypothetical protein